MIINLKIKNMKNDFTQITSLEEALKRVDEATRNDFNKSLEGYNTPDEIAYKQKKLIAKAIRGDWEPDWVDYNQKKWFPIFYMVSSVRGSVFRIRITTTILRFRVSVRAFAFQMKRCQIISVSNLLKFTRNIYYK
jgi:hypothetical protein